MFEIGIELLAESFAQLHDDANRITGLKIDVTVVVVVVVGLCVIKFN